MDGKKFKIERGEPVMNESMIDYIANIIASALLANGNEERNNTLRDEHNEVLKKVLKN